MNYSKLKVETLINYHLIFGDVYLLDADRQKCSPATCSYGGRFLTELYRADRRYAVPSYGRKYQHRYRTDRYQTLSLTR